MDWALLTHQIINALTLGGIYALIAVGYSMVYGIIKLINFAHGEIYMIGAFCGVLLIGNLGLAFWPALLLAMLICAALGIAVDRIAYRPLRNAPRLAPLITAIGMSLFLQNLAMLLWGSEPRSFPDLQPVYTVTWVEPAATGAAPPETSAAARRFCEGLHEGLERVRAGRLDEAPFLAQYQARRAELLRRQAAGEPDANLAATRRALEQARRDVPRLVATRLVATEDQQPALVAQFRRGTPGHRALALLNDAAVWAAAASGLSMPASGASPVTIVKETHPFEQPAIRWSVPSGSDRHAWVVLPWKIVTIWITVLVCVTALEWLVTRTRLGRAMRACALDKATASLMGVHVDRVIAATFAIGSALAAVAGIMYALYIGSNVFFRMGYYAGVIAFAAAVLGGIGNLRGAIIGGLLLGFVESFSKAYLTGWLASLLGRPVSSSYSIAFAFLLLILVILIRPAGLFGRPASDRA